MILLGLDVSMSDTGVAVYDTEKDKFLEILSIPTDKVFRKVKKDMPWESEFHGSRLKLIYDKLTEIKNKYKIDTVISERGFSRFNKSTQVVYKVHGVSSLVFYDIPCIYYTTKGIKESVTSTGNATKFAIKEFIIKRYPELKDVLVNDNESDACACVLAYMITNDNNYKYLQNYDEILDEIIEAEKLIEEEIRLKREENIRKKKESKKNNA